MIYYGLEYKYIAQYLKGDLEYDEMFTHLNIAIHQFAKRQMTWFRRMERNGMKIHWLDANLPDEQKLEMTCELLRASE
jgi:tRNA dimethylallyltransferase